MSTSNLQTAIDAAWEARDEISFETKGEVRDAVDHLAAVLDVQRTGSAKSHIERVTHPLRASARHGDRAG